MYSILSIILCLGLPELGIKPFLLIKKLLVCARLDNGPGIKDEDQVAETARGHPMGDINTGLAVRGQDN